MSERRYDLKQYPLAWPEGWKRTASYQQKDGRFKIHGNRATVNLGINRILEELRMMGIQRDDVLISTNVPVRIDGLPRSDQREPADPGAAVYWRKSQNAQMSAIAIDIYSRVADNLCAIAATLEALRAIERHGGAQVQERSFRGFAAGARPWREVLGMEGIMRSLITSAYIEQRFRELLRKRHPDVGGTSDEMAELNVARDEALREIAESIAGH